MMLRICTTSLMLNGNKKELIFVSFWLSVAYPHITSTTCMSVFLPESLLSDYVVQRVHIVFHKFTALTFIHLQSIYSVYSFISLQSHTK